MLLSSIVFLTVTLGLIGAMLLIPGLRGERLRGLKNPGTASDSHRTPSLFKDIDVLSLDSAQEYALFADKIPTAGVRLWTQLEKMLEAAELTLRPGVFLLATAGTALILAATSWLIAGWLGAILALGLGLVGPLLFVSYRGRMLREQYVRQLPAAFELMARVIRSGQSPQQALVAVTEAFDGPLSRGFAMCYQQQQFGVPAETAFKELAERSGVLEMRIFVMAMLIQRATGGHLSDVLDRLSLLIRTRLRLKQQVRTLTAEGRLQGLTLVILPFVMFGVMFFLNRPYATVLLEQPSLLVATGVLMMIGVLWIRKIVNFEA